MTDREITRGDNNPPELLPSLPPELEAVPAELLGAAIAEISKPDTLLPFNVENLATLKVQVNKFSDACGRWKDVGPLQNAEQSERLTDFISGARALWKRVDSQRAAEKKPWSDKADEVQAAFSVLLRIAERCSGDLKPIQEDWLKREAARIEREKAEAARLAREKAEEAARLAAQAEARNDVAGAVEAEALAKAAAAEAKAASRPVSAKAGSATGAGRTMALRTVRSAVIDNQNAVYMHFRDRPEVADVLQHLANAAIRSGETVPGCTAKEDQVAA